MDNPPSNEISEAKGSSPGLTSEKEQPGSPSAQTDFEQRLAEQILKEERALIELDNDEKALAEEPLIDRIVSSRWEARLHGLKELNREKPELSKYISVVLNLLKDKNVTVQKEAIDVITTYVQKLNKDEALTLWNDTLSVSILGVISTHRMLQSFILFDQNVFSSHS